METDFKKQFEEIESLIKSAKWEAAQKRLIALRKKRFPKTNVLDFSKLCRRANLPDVGLSVLRPFVKPSLYDHLTSNDLYRAEYAANLISVGACSEAGKLLSSINLEKNPEVRFFKAGLHLREWDFSSAAPLYQAYIKGLESNTYQKAVANLNLAMCLIFEERYEEATSCINDVLVTDASVMTPLLKGNAYRMFGALEFQRGNYPFALMNFQRAYSIFSDSAGLERFNIRKWIALCSYFSSSGSELAKIAVDGIKQEAIIRNNPESVRDIDYQIACFHKDEKTLLKLYFGTPFEGFKERLTKRFPDLLITKEYFWEMNGGGEKSPYVFDMTKLKIKPGQSAYRLLGALQSDFYRSFSVVEVFEKTFPDEHYSLASSKFRVYNVVKILREIFKKGRVPLLISTVDSKYSLEAVGPVTVVCRDSRFGSASSEEHRINKLRQEFKEKQFNAVDVAELLDVSRRSANILLREALDNGSLCKQGKGSATKYYFPENGVLPLKTAA